MIHSHTREIIPTVQNYELDKRMIMQSWRLKMKVRFCKNEISIVPRV